jgi:hypothetical protein
MIKLICCNKLTLFILKAIMQSFHNIQSAIDYLQDKFESEGFDAPIYHFEKTIVDDTIDVIETEKNIIVSCLKYDTEPQDFFEEEENGINPFTVFRSAGERDDVVEKLEEKGLLYYLVDKYAHGNVHYSVTNTQSYPDSRWDVASGCGIYIPSEYVQDEYKALAKKENPESAKLAFLEDANITLDTYSNLCNGEVYAYSVAIFDKKGETIDENECWGLIGYDYATKEKQNILIEYLCEIHVNNLYKVIVIENKSANDLKDIPFTIEEKDLISFKIAQVYDDIIVAATYKEEAIVYHKYGNEDKLVMGKFEEWQKNHGVTPEQFLEARFKSDIKEVIRYNLQHQAANKLTMK